MNMSTTTCPKHGTGGGPCYCPGSIYAQKPLQPLQPLPPIIIGCNREGGGVDCTAAQQSPEIFSCKSYDQAIANFVMRRAQELKKEPADLLWLGDTISSFLHSPEFASSQHKIAVLIKASLDAAVQLDDKAVDEETRVKHLPIVERVYAACEVLGEVIGANT